MKVWMTLTGAITVLMEVESMDDLYPDAVAKVEEAATEALATKGITVTNVNWDIFESGKEED